MAHTDAIVLGAGIVGTSIALHLVKRGLSVALVDRRGPGEETSYGNAGVIEGNTLFPHAFPSSFDKLLRIALKQAPEANYHLSILPQLAPWLLAYRTNTRREGSLAFAKAMRPLFSRAVAEHEALMAESNATHYLRKDGWLKLYRTDDALAATARERELASELGLPFLLLDGAGARALEPSLAPVFRHAVHWPAAASVSNPLAVTKAYAGQFVILGGVMLKGDARTLHRSGSNWRIDTEEGALDTKDVVAALGPWSPDLLGPLGIKLPLAVKRGYHLHFRAKGNAGLTRPEELFPLGEPVEPKPWKGSRPCFADSRPVIGPAPGQAGLWLAYGHAHWGLTLGPVTGRLVADMVTGATPFCDPAPYTAERFGNDRAA